ncbi:hypothetical protein F5051DRAFT_433732 [Lentinula edodes]|nr:hypothetical protein F5051DRAFT_433732 [Lentinula edodes]
MVILIEFSPSAKTIHLLDPYEPAQFLILLMVINVVHLARVLDLRTYDKTLPKDVAHAYGVGEAYANRLLEWLATNVRRHHVEEQGIEGANSSITTESVRGAIEEESFAETDWFREQWPKDDDEWDELWLTNAMQRWVDEAWDIVKDKNEKTPLMGY